MRIAGGSVTLPPLTLVDLSGPVPKVALTGLTSPLGGGETIQLSFTFAEAGTITFGVPVQPHAYEYATYSPPPIPTPSATKAHPPVGGSASVSASASGSASAGASASPSATP